MSRIEVTPGSQSDLDEAIMIAQDSVLLPLDEFINRNPDYINPIIQKPDFRVNPLDISGLNFFTELNKWLTANPPPPSDDEILKMLAKIGVGPGFTTDFNSLSFEERAALLAGIEIGSQIVQAQYFGSESIFNGWFYDIQPNFGDWGTDYLLRAAIARFGLGANVL